jgi:hypothetical protein
MEWHQILITVVSTLVTAVVLPLITVVGKKLSDWIATKIDHEELNAHIADGIHVVTTAVNSVMQSYVDGLKKANKFDSDAQKTALQMAKDRTKALLSDEVEKIITTKFGDLDTWIEAQIESTISKSKTGTAA